MPRLARLYVHSALLCLTLGGLLGGLLLWNKGMPFAPRLAAWLPVHIALVTWGWLWNLTLGVAFWILPRFARPAPPKSVTARSGDSRGGRPGSAVRGVVWLAWAAYLCLNASLAVAALGPLWPGPWPSALSGLLQLLSAVTFAAHAWPRVKPAGR